MKVKTWVVVVSLLAIALVVGGYYLLLHTLQQAARMM